VAATVLVTLLPAAIVWELRERGVLGSFWGELVVSMLLALLATSAGSAFWRRHSSGDVLFSDLPVWGRLRRARMQRRIRRADDVLREAHAADPERKAQLLGDLAAALDAQEPYLDGHSRRVARYATMTARRMDLPDEQVERVQAAAAVHDIGKLAIPAEVVGKPGRLTDAEFAQMKRHAGEGGAMLADLGEPELAGIVRAHHERWDGSGYPAGLAGEEIPPEARIISVADTFDAITSARAYRPATEHERALEVIDEEAGAQLDPAAARAFISCYSDRRGAALWSALVTQWRALANAISAPVLLSSVAVASAAVNPAPAETPDHGSAAVAPTPSVRASPAPSATPSARPTSTPTAAAPAESPAPSVTPWTSFEPVAIPAAAAETPALAAAPTPTPTPTPSAVAPPDPLAPVVIPTITPVPTPAPPLPTPTPSPTPSPAPTAEPTATATPHPPHTAEDCKNGGWEDLGYPNQGQCIADATGP
jgi:HD-GYP domain-containing protein (c-di-GMP phosphodiesterase class II)